MNKLRESVIELLKTAPYHIDGHWPELDEVVKALAQPEQEPVAWTKVSDKLPKSGVIVLACYKNRLGKLRCIRAHWVAAKTVETSVDYGECFEYDEETDEYYLPEGWYECMDNWDDYSSVAVCEGEVTHWMPLPPAPDEAHTAPSSKQEPFAFVSARAFEWLSNTKRGDTAFTETTLSKKPTYECKIPLYTAPPSTVEFTRVIEAAHGIKEK